jgi:hypothetical protein
MMVFRKVRDEIKTKIEELLKSLSTPPSPSREEGNGEGE